jgi:hypothetical protein
MTSSTHGQRTARHIRPITIPFVVGVFMLTFGVAVFGTYTQGWTWSINSYGIWAWVGSWFLAVSLGLFGFGAFLREGTAPFVSSSGLNPQGDWAPMDVTLHSGPVDPKAVRRLQSGDPTEATMKVVGSTMVGRDAKGRPVPVQVVALGGINSMGIHITAGGLGFLILRGNQVIPMGDAHRGEFYYTPRVFRTLHISNVEEEIIDVARQHPKFKYGVSPLYDLGGFGKGFLEFLWDNEEEIREYLKEPHVDGPLGRADANYYQGRYQWALTEIWNFRAQGRHHLDTIQSQAEAMSGQARRTANVYSGREPVEPAQSETYRKPQEETR